MAGVDDIRELPRAEDRMTQSHAYILRGVAAVADGRSVRRQSIIELLGGGWTQVQVAERLGVSQSAVSKILQTRVTAKPIGKITPKRKANR